MVMERLVMTPKIIDMINIALLTQVIASQFYQEKCHSITKI